MIKLKTWVPIAGILILVLSTVILFLPARTASATAGIPPVYVNVATGNDSWDGSSPTNTAPGIGPKKTIAAGYDAVSDGGTVNVAAGTYPENSFSFTKAFTLAGAGAGAVSTIIDATGGWGVTINAATVTISRLTIENGLDLNNGGGLTVVNGATVTVNDCVIKNNVGKDGGGICVAVSSTLDMNGCTISGNSSPSSGYGGGGMRIRNSTVSLTNCTISGNSENSTAYNYGGGIQMFSNDDPVSTATLTDCTMVNNTSTGQGGGFYIGNGNTITFTNTIVANNTATKGGNNGYEDVAGTVTSEGYNLDSEDSCGFDQSTDLINTNPLLGLLQNNGGPSFTHALLSGSPAIDAGTCKDAPDTDQRGISRPRVHRAISGPTS